MPRSERPPTSAPTPTGRSQDALARVAEGLALPQPERTWILEEIAMDLEELRTGLVERGLPADEAEARAVRVLVPSEPAIEALVRLYEPPYRKLTRRFSPSVMRGLERLALLLVTFTVLGIAGIGLLRSGLPRDPSTLLSGIFGLAGGILVLAGWKATRLVFVRDHDPSTLRSGLGHLLVASGIALLAGTAGLILEFRNLAAAVQRTGEISIGVATPWLLDSSVLVASSLVTALVGGLCWFLLLQKVDAVERAHERAERILGRSRTPGSVSLSGLDESTLTRHEGARP